MLSRFLKIIAYILYLYFLPNLAQISFPSIKPILTPSLTHLKFLDWANHRSPKNCSSSYSPGSVIRPGPVKLVNPELWGESSLLLCAASITTDPVSGSLWNLLAALWSQIQALCSCSGPLTHLPASRLGAIPSDGPPCHQRQPWSWQSCS